MKKVVINKCFGGYGLSKEAYEFMGIEWDDYGFEFMDDRSNPKLVKCVEALGDRASGSCAELCIEEYDEENFECSIDEYDGAESLELFPIVREDRLCRCCDTNEIMNYIESLGVTVKRCKQTL